MSARNDGGPAFPVPILDGGAKWACGLSLRDYFAAKANKESAERTLRILEAHGSIKILELVETVLFP